jgi:hypothetical protein
MVREVDDLALMIANPSFDEPSGVATVEEVDRVVVEDCHPTIPQEDHVIAVVLVSDGGTIRVEEDEL